MLHAQNGNYDVAEQQLSNIQKVRERAQYSIKQTLIEKHQNEAQQVEELNREEFQEFTLKWEE